MSLFLAVGWDLAKEIYKEHLSDKLRKTKLRNLRYLAMDEFSIRKGHPYMTLVLDLETGRILHVHECKNGKVLKRQAYGFRDMVYFKLRLYFTHETTSAFAG